MKKSFILLMTGILFACNHQKPAANKTTVVTLDADEHQADAKTEKLILNNGVKWKVDIITNNNVNNVKGILEKSNEGSKSPIAYKKTYTELHKAINTMIALCKMKGPDHEALHKWLEPLMTDVEKFKQAPTIPDAVESLKVIRAQVNLYDQYFELGAS